MSSSTTIIARHNKAEALRVAAGLTLLTEPGRVAVLGALEDTPAVAEQRELLEFAEVPCEEFADPAAARGALAGELRQADVVYVI